MPKVSNVKGKPKARAKTKATAQAVEERTARRRRVRIAKAEALADENRDPSHVTILVKKAGSRIPTPVVCVVEPLTVLVPPAPLPSFANPHLLALLPDKSTRDHAATHSAHVPSPPLAIHPRPLAVHTTTGWLALSDWRALDAPPALLLAQDPALFPAPAIAPPLPHAPSISEPAPLLRKLHWADHLVLGLLSPARRARVETGLARLAAAPAAKLARLRAHGGPPLFLALVLERGRAISGACAFWAATRASGEVRTSALEHWMGLALSHEEHVVAAGLFCLDVLSPAEMRAAILAQRAEPTKMRGDVLGNFSGPDMCVPWTVLQNV